VTYPFDEKIDELARVMAEVREAIDNRNEFIMREHIEIGARLDRVDPKWRAMRLLASQHRLDWDELAREAKHFPTKADLAAR
jgi:hypothetical protein